MDLLGGVRSLVRTRLGYEIPEYGALNGNFGRISTRRATGFEIYPAISVA